jgi:Icc-related predicted phosphoesterase
MRAGLGFYKHKMRGTYDRIPGDTDVLITHGPPRGILDLPTNANGVHVGDGELATALFRIQPQIHAFGHIHEGHGVVHKFMPLDTFMKVME